MKKYCTLLVLISIFIFSCTSAKRVDNELFVNISSEPKTIDPTLSGNDFIYPRHAFEGLITKDAEGKNSAGVAESWNISDDGKTYTFTLRTNSIWNDGKIVTANDFEYGIKRAADPNSGAEYTSFIGYIKNGNNILTGEMGTNSLGVRALDDYTLEIVLENPTAYFTDLLTYPIFFPVRSDIIEEHGDAWTLNVDTYIGNGAFKLSERNLDDKMVFTKNEDYWNKEAIKPTKITFILSKDQTLALSGVIEGSLDFSNNPSEQDVSKLIKEGIAYTRPYFGTFAFAINNTNEFLKDPRVRKALSLVIDRQFIIENIAMSGQTPAGAWVPYGTEGINGDFREEGGDYVDIDPKNYEKNIEEAKRLLTEAGYPNGENTPILEFSTTTYLPYIQVAEAVQEMWKKNLGVNLRIAATEWAVHQQARLDKNFILMRNNWIGDYNDPMTFLETFLSDSGQNYSGYSNQDFDKLIEFAKSTPNREERLKALHAAEKLFIAGDDAVLIPIHYSAIAVIANPKLKGVVISPLGDMRFHYAYIE